jgi:predicted enzyme related to lactoylglutathione lyase
MLKGFATINYFAADLATARDWYTELLGVPPYLTVAPPGQPMRYCEFRVGDYQHELGLVDSGYAGPDRTGASGPVMYWHVEDLPGCLGRLLDLGATRHEDIRDRGNGFATASVVDPFGNVVGIMTNPHYVQIRDAAAPAPTA